jgi:hypothetical protein
LRECTRVYQLVAQKFSHRYKFKSLYAYMRGCTMYLTSGFATNISHINKQSP